MRASRCSGDYEPDRRTVDTHLFTNHLTEHHPAAWEMQRTVPRHPRLLSGLLFSSPWLGVSTSLLAHSIFLRLCLSSGLSPSRGGSNIHPSGFPFSFPISVAGNAWEPMCTSIVQPVEIMAHFSLHLIRLSRLEHAIPNNPQDFLEYASSQITLRAFLNTEIKRQWPEEPRAVGCEPSSTRQDCPQASYFLMGGPEDHGSAARANQLVDLSNKAVY